MVTFTILYSSLTFNHIPMKKIAFIIVLCFSALTTCIGQVLQTDNFNGTTLSPFWSVHSPNPASMIQLTGNGEVLVKASAANGGSDLYFGTNYNAPRILQAVDTNNISWMVEMKLSFDPVSDFQGAGLLVHSSADPNDSTASVRIVEKSFWSGWGVKSVSGPLGIYHYPYSDSVVYFRVQKSQDSVITSYSSDNNTYTYLGSQFIPKVYFVGFHCMRQPHDGNLLLDSYAHFDYFIAYNTLAIEENEQDFSFQLYSNPLSDSYLKFKFLSHKDKSAVLELFDTSGRRVFDHRVQSSSNQQQIHIPNLSNGMYVCRLFTNGKSTAQKIAILTGH